MRHVGWTLHASLCIAHIRDQDCGVEGQGWDVGMGRNTDMGGNADGWMDWCGIEIRDIS